jgi:hypothetical protein
MVEPAIHRSGIQEDGSMTTSPRRTAAVRKIKTRYRKLLRSHGVPEFVIRELYSVQLLRSFSRSVCK